MSLRGNFFGGLVMSFGLDVRHRCGVVPEIVRPDEHDVGMAAVA
jgi:hypothetical protein